MSYQMVFIGCGSMAGFIDGMFEDHPSVVLPYSHAAAAEAMPELTLAACADPNPAARDRFGDRYAIPPNRATPIIAGCWMK